MLLMVEVAVETEDGASPGAPPAPVALALPAADAYPNVLPKSPVSDLC